MSDQDYTIHVNQDDDGSLWAKVVELPGCFASGNSLDELRDSLEEAIALYNDDASGPPDELTGDRIPRVGPLVVGEMKVTIHG